MLYKADSLIVSELADDFVELHFDAPGAVNKLDRQTLCELTQALNLLESLPSLRGLLITSGKNHFIVGADITEFFSLFALPPAELASWLNEIQTLFNRIESLPCPTLALLRGHVLGGGCELALCCDFRLADESVTMGLPETTLGIMPGWGGTVRLPRLIGCDHALRWITTGLEQGAKQALAQGALDGIVPSSLLHTAGVHMLTRAISGQLPWQARREQKQAPLSLPDIEASLCEQSLASQIMGQTGGFYPAPLQALRTIMNGRHLERDAALALERLDFISLTQTPQATALVGLFLNEQGCKNHVKSMPRVTTPAHIAVLGAGIMGTGIAYQSARHQIPVHLKEIQPAALSRGVEELARLVTHEWEKGRLSPHECAKLQAGITPTLSYAEFSQLDLVIEAVVEQAEIKRQVLAEVEQTLSPDAILTTNSSTIPIQYLAEGLRRPAQFCGMHFFNPVPKMRLVEVIRTPHTSPQTLAKVCQLALSLGKLPIVVNDCPGFFVNRVLFAYLTAFRQLVAAGVDPYQIDRVMEQSFGWPMGPAWLLDVIGLDTAQQATTIMAAGYPSRMAPSGLDPLAHLVTAGELGQKRNIGFYRYSRDASGVQHKQARSAPWPWATGQSTPDCRDQNIEQQMMIPLLLEVVLCLEEQIIASPAEGDMALLHGLGFPAFRGGPFRYLDQQGLAEWLSTVETYAHLGPLYWPSAGLRQRAASGTYFY